MVFWTPAIHNPFLFHGFDEPMLLALKFEKDGTELSFVSEANTYPNCVLKRLISQVLENCLETHKSAEEELDLHLKKKTKHHNKNTCKKTSFCRHWHFCSLQSGVMVEFSRRDSVQSDAFSVYSHLEVSHLSGVSGVNPSAFPSI